MASPAIRSSIGVDKPGGARERRRRAHQHVDLHGAAEFVVLQDRRLVVRRRPGAGDALDLGDSSVCAMPLASSSRRGMTSASAGSSLTPRAVCPVSRHSTDIDMLVRSFDQIVSRISRDLGRFDRGLVERGAQPCDPLARAVVAFADQEPVALRREIGDDAGRDDLVGRKDHAADDPLLRDRGAQPAAGIEKGRDRAAADDRRAGRYRTTRECRSAQTPRRCRRAAAAAGRWRGWPRRSPSAC